MVLNVALFGGVLQGDLAYDDFAVVENPEVIEGPLLDPELLKHPERVLRTLSVRLDRALFGERTSLYHLQNLLLHVLSVILLSRLSARVSQSRMVGIFAGLLFSLQPAHVEAIANIANRKELLAMFFTLAASLAYLRALGAKRRPAAWMGAAFLLWVLAVFSKEVTIVLPIVLAAYERLFVAREKRRLTRRPLLFSGAVALGAAAVVWLVLNAIDMSDLRRIRTLGGYEGEDPTAAAVVLTAGRAFWIHLQLLVAPLGLSPDHTLRLSRTIFDPVTTGLAWAGVLGVLASIPWMARNARVCAFGVLWFLIFYSPTSNLLPVAYVVAERYLYIPSGGIALAAGWATLRLFEAMRGRLAGRAAALVGVMCVAYLVVLGIASVIYTRAWRSERSLWEWALEANPDSARAHVHLGVEDFVEGRLDAALRHLDRSIELDDRSSLALYNRGRVHDQRGDAPAAIEDYTRALERRADLWAAHSNLGAIYLEERSLDEALFHLDRAIAIYRAHPNAWLNRGAVRMLQGDSRGAIEDLEHLLTLEPDNPIAHQYLAHIHSKLGDEARAQFHRSLSGSSP